MNSSESDISTVVSGYTKMRRGNMTVEWALTAVLIHSFRGNISFLPKMSLVTILQSPGRFHSHATPKGQNQCSI